ncbi:MAG: PAS domain S-box protein [Campylobacterota bacterium]|nr:PAS domain S-box protein [Campylobacterota bacterium]
MENNTEFNKILVIEKSKKICEQIKDILKPRNYDVTLVNDLIQAYELLKRDKYALVILDTSYKDSFKFLADIKTTIDRSLPFIVLTDTNRSYNIVRDSFKNGASDALRKPIFAEEFILKVDQSVEYYKTIQELTRQSQLLESYKNIVDHSVIVSKTNPQGVITYVNKMFCKLSGYSEKELLNKPHNIVRHPDVPKELFRDMWETIEAKQVWRGVVKNQAKDGSTYIVETSIMPIINLDGEIEEYISLRNDITALYKRERE